jgi:hypothetical protein
VHDRVDGLQAVRVGQPLLDIPQYRIGKTTPRAATDGRQLISAIRKKCRQRTANQSTGAADRNGL